MYVQESASIGGFFNSFLQRELSSDDIIHNCCVWFVPMAEEVEVGNRSVSQRPDRGCLFSCSVHCGGGLVATGQHNWMDRVCYTQYEIYFIFKYTKISLKICR